jgi:hypothetical protein
MPIRVQAVLVNILEDQKVENINVVCYHKVGLACRSTHTLTAAVLSAAVLTTFRCRLPALTALHCIALRTVAVRACWRVSDAGERLRFLLIGCSSISAAAGWLAGCQGGREEAAPEDGLRVPAAERLRLHA